MKTRFLLATVTLALLTASGFPADDSLPHLRRQGTATQLIVEGRPFLMLAGELHNSSASSLEYMRPIWDKLVVLNLNTVLATLSWELVEPEEGRFDFTLLDGLVQEARRHKLRLVLLWFGSWKNGVSSYTPAWVKRDTQRFPRALGRHQNKKDMLSPFSETNCAADARAFAAVMRHLRQIDGRERTVLMMQVENEVGFRPETRDATPAAEAAFKAPVPAELIGYLRQHKNLLLPELKSRWTAAGCKEAGSWTELFGEGIETDEIFMAWHYARYLGKVAQAGKEIYPLPMYVNAWLEGDGKPGDYPCGGPVSKMMDIWRAAAPAIDVFAPDIYLPDFKAICARYTRSGNPLLIPEHACEYPVAAKAFWAFAQHDAIGFSPFGIENLDPAHPLVEAYALLAQLTPLIAQFQGTGRMAGIFRQAGEPDEKRAIELGDWRANIAYESRPGSTPTLGLVINTGPEEFLVAGNGFSVNFTPLKPGPRNSGILRIQEGRFEKGKWIGGRWLNGDETGANGAAKLPPFAGKPRILRVTLYRFD